MTDNVEVQVTPLVRVALAGQDDYEIPFRDLIADAHGEDNPDLNPATISDNDVIELVATHMDITVPELVARIYGEENPRGGYDNDEVGIKVRRPETGNIMLTPETKLG